MRVYKTNLPPAILCREKAEGTGLVASIITTEAGALVEEASEIELGNGGAGAEVEIEFGGGIGCLGLRWRSGRRRKSRVLRT
jgi:hypothetical protein